MRDGPLEVMAVKCGIIPSIERNGEDFVCPICMSADPPFGKTFGEYLSLIWHLYKTSGKSVTALMLNLMITVYTHIIIIICKT